MTDSDIFLKTKDTIFSNLSSNKIQLFIIKITIYPGDQADVSAKSKSSVYFFCFGGGMFVITVFLDCFCFSEDCLCPLSDSLIVSTRFLLNNNKTIVGVTSPMQPHTFRRVLKSDVCLR